MVVLGEKVTIHCEGLFPGLRFFVYKSGHKYLQELPKGNVAEFPFTSVRQEDGGSYTCDYHLITNKNCWSELSDTVKLVVRGEGPTYYPTSSLGLALWRPQCPGQAPGPRDSPSPSPKEVLETVAQLRQQGQGRVTVLVCLTTCLPHTDSSYPRPTIFLSPSWPIAPGQNVTIRCECQCQHWALMFFLHKDGEPGWSSLWEMWLSSSSPA